MLCWNNACSYCTLTQMLCIMDRNRNSIVPFSYEYIQPKVAEVANRVSFKDLNLCRQDQPKAYSPYLNGVQIWLYSNVLSGPYLLNEVQIRLYSDVLFGPYLLNEVQIRLYSDVLSGPYLLQSYSCIVRPAITDVCEHSTYHNRNGLQLYFESSME